MWSFSVVVLLVSAFSVTQAKKNEVIKVQVCQGNNAPINCGNQAIHIFSATYGRRDKHTCKGPLDITLFWSVDCGATNNALDAVRNDCKGSAACELNANDDRFGDPCWGTPKYLEVHYKCCGKKGRWNQHKCVSANFKDAIDLILNRIQPQCGFFSVVVLLVSAFCVTKSQKNEERDVLLCEGGKQLIKCEHQEINIMSASYGRTDRDVCQWGLDWTVAWLWNVNCHADKVVDVLRGECQDLSECELHANSAEFGDPCFGTKKYLQVKYKCVGQMTPDDTKRERICENQKMSLECPEKRNIDIVWANFGRLKGGHICGDGFFGAFSWYQGCDNANSVAIARAFCQDKEYCTLDANTETFGDECWGTTKYLEVRYRCCPKKGGCD
ncbi:hypothetical protein OS493_007145 [Desmophyllum pertusum]|uniref:SUEL-type lectin domain-containing protein n=1 Tax=Desmophyllum pertusum TaxID=174260 RepID=A0A9W9ZFN5_9CNID|nr:hypothetical protein OS493_007145 [Desmophyllum pertusum]